MTTESDLMLKKYIELIKTITEIIECPICYDENATFQCITGHRICNKCKTKLKICPQCQKAFLGTKSFIVDELNEALLQNFVGTDTTNKSLTYRKLFKDLLTKLSTFLNSCSLTLRSCTDDFKALRNSNTYNLERKFTTLQSQLIHLTDFMNKTEKNLIDLKK